MPRIQIDIAGRLDHLAILDENGWLDKTLEPEIPPELLIKLHRIMLLSRRFDERLLNLQRQGRIGTFGPIKGQEAAQLGAVALLRDSDWMVPCFREMAAMLWRGTPLEGVILTYGGFNEGGRIPDNQNDLPIAIPVASQLLHAVGLAWAIKYRQKDDIAMVFFGDGATSEGDFHEALNFAGVFQAPVIFVCQNNQWAISIPRSKQTRAKTLAQKAFAYGVPGIQVDGNDILAVYTAAKEAVDRARQGGGPTMIECITYRMMMHTTADDPRRYRTEEEVEKWAKRDPLSRFQKYLTVKGLLVPEKIDVLEKEVETEIQEAVNRAEKQMKNLTDPLHMFEHHFADMPVNVLDQQQELAQELAEQKEEQSNG